MGKHFTIKLSPFLRDVVSTTVTSVVTIASLVVVTSLLARGLRPEEFGAYSLTRRLVTTIAPLSTLAMWVALPRYLGMYRGRAKQSYAYLLAALGISVVTTLLVIMIGLALQALFTRLIFQNLRYQPLFRAALFMLVGYGLYVTLYGYYLGIGRMNHANLWQLGVVGLGPMALAGIFANQANAEQIVWLFGGLFMLTALPLGYYSLRGLAQLKGTTILKRTFNDLVKYGWPRTPGGLAFVAILAFGPLLAPHFGTLKDAGYLVVAQSLLSIAETGALGFSLVVLPKAAQLVAAGEESMLRDKIGDLIAFVFDLGLFGMLHIILWSPTIVTVWLGQGYEGVVPLMRIIILCLIPYLSYVTLRSIVDAVKVQAINTINRCVALAITATISLGLANAGLGITGLAIGTTSGIIGLGGLTIYYLWRRYKFDTRQLRIGRCTMINALFLLPAWASYRYLVGPEGSILPAFLVETILFITYLALLRKWGVGWVMELQKRIQIGGLTSRPKQ